MISSSPFRSVLLGCLIAVTGVIQAQDGEVIPAAAGQNAKSVLADIQTKVDRIQTLKADLEFDRKSEKKKKKKKKKQTEQPAKPKIAWDEPEGRAVERGPLEISRGAGARLLLERRKEQEIYVANSSVIWKHEVHDKEARRVSSSWPIIDTFVANALKINVFVAMEPDTIRLKGTQNVDGVPCWLMEGKSPSKLEMVGVESTKLRIWIGKADGVPRLISVPSEKDTKIRLKNITLNTPIDAARFQYSPPSDVKVKNILGF